MAVQALMSQISMPKYKTNLFLSSTKFAVRALLSPERRLLKVDHLMSNLSLSNNYKTEIAE